MTLQNGDTLTKLLDGEIFVTSSVVQGATSTQFTTTLDWKNPPVVTVNEQLPLHVFAADGLCSPLPTGNVVSNWKSTPVVPGNRWVLKAYMSDKVTGYIYVGGFTTDGTNPHTTYQKIYRNGILIKSHTQSIPSLIGAPVPGSNPPVTRTTNDIIADEFVDFYSDGDSGQMFWYAPGANGINFSFNFQGFPRGLNFTDISATIEPLSDAETLNFSVLSAFVTIGQISNANPVIDSKYIQEPQIPTCALSQTLKLSPPNTNACWTFKEMNHGKYPDKPQLVSLTATLTKM
jgi:hypothetical protein